MTRCGDLARVNDGAAVAVAGVILVRQRPGSAKDVLFITIEDETGVANIILWPDRFEAHRPVVMSAAMLSVRGRVQKADGVIAVIADVVLDETALLRSIGDMDLPRLTAPSDGMRGGSPDRGDDAWRPRVKTDYHFRDKERDLPIKSRDFH